jgi:hypothetical protein
MKLVYTPCSNRLAGGLGMIRTSGCSGSSIRSYVYSSVDWYSLQVAFKGSQRYVS